MIQIVAGLYRLVPASSVVGLLRAADGYREDAAPDLPDGPATGTFPRHGRCLFWSHLLSGTAGHTYGAQGVWAFNTREYAGGGGRWNDLTSVGDPARNG